MTAITQPGSVPAREGKPRMLRAAAVGFVALLAVLWLLPPALMSLHRFQRTYNEGWNVFRSSQASKGELIYPAGSRFRVANYPPLSFHLTSVVAVITHDFLVAGRVLSVIGLFVTSACIGLIVFGAGKSAWAAAIAAFGFLAGLARYAPEYIFLDDPQLFAHAMVMSGVALATSRSGLRGWAMAGLLVAGGLFTKHNVLAFPIALVLFLVLQRRWRECASFCAAAGTLAVVFTALTLAVDGPAFFEGLLTPRVVSVKESLLQLVEFNSILYPILVAAVSGLLFAKRRYERSALITIAFIAACILGLAFGGGRGVGRNVYFDGLIAACIGAGLGLSYLERQNLFRPSVIAVLPIIFTLPYAWDRIPGFQSSLRRARAVSSNEAVWHRDASAFLSTIDGPALCEVLLVCYDAGKAMDYDPFLVNQLVQTGRIPERTILDQLATGYWKGIVLYGTSEDLRKVEDRPHFSQRFMAQLFERYRAAQSFGNITIFVPREGLAR